MAVANTLVFLWAWGGPFNLKDRDWYQKYFFDPFRGQAAYWSKQSDTQVLLAGEVLDWAIDDDSNRDFSKRVDTAVLAINYLEKQRGVDFNRFDIVIIVLALPKAKKSDGGSARGIKTANGRVNAVVARTGDSFGFVTHEIGHALGLDHSFSFDSNFQVIGDVAGAYGHPHCIMSAAVYGGNSEAQHDAPLPFSMAPEYTAIGPSLNGVTAAARGWIDTHSVKVDSGFSGQFEMRARQWGGRNSALPPQGISLKMSDNSSYVVDFYESRDWDSGLVGNRLIITQDRGGLGEQKYPKSHVGTWRASMALPASLAGPRGVINIPGPIGLLPLFYDPTRHTLTIQVTGSVVSGGVIKANENVETVVLVGGNGAATFAKGERFCVIGDWPWTQQLRTQTVTIEVTHPRAHPGTLVQWSVDGVLCPGASGTATLSKMVQVSDPKILNLKSAREVKLAYRIEQRPQGSRMVVTNRPEDETYDVAVTATFTTSVATSTCELTLDFRGKTHVFTPAFYEQYQKCVGEFLNKKVKDGQVKVVFDPAQIKRPGPAETEAVRWLDGLAALIANGDRTTYELAADSLRESLGRPDLRLLTFDASDRIKINAADGLVPPPGTFPEDGQSPRIVSSATSQRAGLLFAAIAGASASLIIGSLFRSRR